MHVKRAAGQAHRSKLETDVEKQLLSYGLSPIYEQSKYEYILKRKYTPDFQVGDVFIEVKGWWPPHERQKFLSVLAANPKLKIFVALQRPEQRLSKTSSTTLAKWCEKHGVCWSSIPIPRSFIERWLNGERITHSSKTKCDAPNAAM